MQQVLIEQLQVEGAYSITPWVYQYATGVLIAARTGGDVDAALSEALAHLPEGYDAETVKQLTLKWLKSDHLVTESADTES